MGRKKGMGAGGLDPILKRPSLGLREGRCTLR